MVRRSNSASLQCESLEAREVPAVVLVGTLNAGTVTPDGGTVTIQEIALSSNAAGTGQNIVENANGTAFVAVNKSPTVNDNITLTNNGGTLSINSADGIFVQFAFGGGTRFRSVGTSLDVQNVTGLNVNLQLGGDDNVTDNTNLTATINGGPGKDNITASGMVNPLLLQFLMAPGGLNPALLPLLGGMGGQKTLQGGDGDDMINGPLFGFFNTLNGGDGNDTIIGGMGLDIITGGNGFDIIFGFGGGDFIIAQDFGPDLILRSPGDIVLGDPFDG